MDHIETKMGDFSKAHNELVDTHIDMEEDVKNIKLKMADLEDKSHGNNVKFRGNTVSTKNYHE